MSVRQESNESLSDYIKRFNEESLRVSDIQDRVTFTALMSGLLPGKFCWSLVENEVTMITEAMIRAQKFIQASDICKPINNSRKRKVDKGLVDHRNGRDQTKAPRSNPQLNRPSTSREDS